MFMIPQQGNGRAEITMESNKMLSTCWGRRLRAKSGIASWEICPKCHLNCQASGGGRRAFWDHAFAVSTARIGGSLAETEVHILPAPLAPTNTCFPRLLQGQ